MPQYGMAQYGLHQYGLYTLSSGGNYVASSQPRMRIRFRMTNGGIGLWVETQNAEETIPGKFPQIRIKTNDGNWVYIQSATLPKHSTKVRVRSLTNDKPSDWVIYEEAKVE
jgi:hypothetical protein